jgi:protein-tyrosine phosphatase
MTGVAPPTEAQITKILALLEDDAAGAVFVHCKLGADRTGAVIAAYRIDHDHWDNSRALKEALSFGMSPFQLPRQNFIRRFQPQTIKKDAKPSIAGLELPGQVLSNVSREMWVGAGRGWAQRTLFPLDKLDL